MAKDNETRAKTQVADLALDLPSGRFLVLWLFAIIARACLCVYVCTRAYHIVGDCFRTSFFFSFQRVVFSKKGGGEKSAQICARRRRRIRPPRSSSGFIPNSHFHFEIIVILVLIVIVIHTKFSHHSSLGREKIQCPRNTRKSSARRTPRLRTGTRLPSPIAAETGYT